ncbi:WD40-repeat-containing domain protein [Melanogaster broomeanus]|nr:WD40-repeat-containing domain protein [Melanogaster broomeanus]
MTNTPGGTPCYSQVLMNTTNVQHKTQGRLTAIPIPTPPEDVPSKRRLVALDETPTKRPRLLPSNEEDSGDDTKDIPVVKSHGRHTMFGMLMASAMRSPTAPRQTIMPSRRILQSFVSSHKSDVYRCHSVADNTFISPPYACAYSYGAKTSRTPVLAVATEEGSVIILDTSKRRDWDFEPQRTVFQPHDNGIFDVKWSLDDSMLATASGDKTSRICSVETQSTLQTLQSHTSTVKCIAWDPSHRAILSTGSRDGMICVWDLRMASGCTVTGQTTSSLQPVITINAAHGQEKSKGGRRKAAPLPRSVTSMLYTDKRPHGLISSGSSDGVLNLWDLRLPAVDGTTRSPKTPPVMTPFGSSPNDPTTFNGSRRPRGISSLCPGSGPTSSLLFALGADSRLHTYSSPMLIPLETDTHPNLRTSFYVRLASSPCGRWLASGCSGKNGSLFLFDVSNAARLSASPYPKCSAESPSAAVELRGQMGDIGAVDWANDMVVNMCGRRHRSRLETGL